MAKFGLIFCVILFTFSVQIHSKHVKTNEAITDLLETLKKVVNKSIIDTITTLTKEMSSLQARSAGIQDDVEPAIKRAASDFTTKLNAVIMGAGNLGVDAEECLGDVKTKISSLADAAVNSFVNNASLLVLEGGEHVILALANVQKAKEDIAVIEKAIEDCGNDENCLDDLSTRIEKDIESIPGTAADEVDIVQKSINLIQTNIYKAGMLAENEITIEGSKLILPVFECISDKLKY